MSGEKTIPALPCVSLDETLAFYVAMGFEITYQQTRPNTYGCVKRGDIELHFFVMKGVDPANSYSTCLVMIEDADRLYQAFAAGLRQHFGKLPAAGIPRITKPSNHNAAGDYRFNVVDPGGNYIRFIQPGSAQSSEAAADQPLSKLGRTLRAAQLLVNAKGDFQAAAEMLDKALASESSDAAAVEQYQALVLRAETAVNLKDHAAARAMLDRAQAVMLTPEERSAVERELQLASELSQLL